MKIKIIFAFCVLCMLLGCGKQMPDNKTFDEECFMSTMGDIDPSQPPLAMNCTVWSFMEGVSMHSNCGCILIKGEVLDHYEYGLNIRLVDDLKGNFPKNIDTFVVWGNNQGCSLTSFLAYGRQENMRMYEKRDVLIMLLAPARDVMAEVEWD